MIQELLSTLAAYWQSLSEVFLQSWSFIFENLKYALAALIVAVAIIIVAIVFPVIKYIKLRFFRFLLSHIKSRFLWWVFISLLFISGFILNDYIDKSLLLYIKGILLLLVFIEIAWLLIKAISYLISVPIQEMGYDIKSLSILRIIISVFIWLFIGIIYLNAIGISITPFLASLGIGGIAIALALQDTLSNLFAGIQIAINKHIKPGFDVSFDDIEGRIVEISWRHVIIRTTADKIIVVPNSYFSHKVITSYREEDISTIFTVNFSVAYGTDLNVVDELALQAIKEAIVNIQGVDHNYQPVISVLAHAESGIDLLAVVRLFDYSKRYAVRNKVLRNIYACFNANNIEIPFPTRTLYLQNASKNVIQDQVKQSKN